MDELLLVFHVMIKAKQLADKSFVVRAVSCVERVHLHSECFCSADIYLVYRYYCFICLRAGTPRHHNNISPLVGVDELIVSCRSVEKMRCLVSILSVTCKGHQLCRAVIVLSHLWRNCAASFDRVIFMQNKLLMPQVTTCLCQYLNALA